MVENSIVLAVFILFIFSFAPIVKWYLKRTNFTRLINTIPGPIQYPLIGTTYLFFGVKREQIFQVFQKLQNDYPLITRTWLGPIGQVHLKKAHHIERVLGASKQHLEKSWGYKFVRRWLGNGLLTSAGDDHWHAHRKMITPTFHFTILESFCEIFAEKSNILVSKLQGHCGTNKPVDVYPFVTKATLDIISEAAMGVQVNAQDDESNNEYVNAIYETSSMIIQRLVRPWLHTNFVYRYSRDGVKFEKLLNILHSFTNNVIEQRKKTRQKNVKSLDGKKKRLAFLDLLLETKEQNTSSNSVDTLSDVDICEEVDTFMFAGHDTTTAALTWTLLLLGLHPEIQENVYTELNEIFQGSQRTANIHDFNEMKYLDRVIKETLRLYPSVPIIGRKLSEDVQIDEYILPKGCQVLIEIYNLHRDETYFPNPEVFDPDRFLPENLVDRHPYAYLPFSAGARNCIGQKFAIYEEKSILSSIIRNFRFKSACQREDLSLINEIILRPVDGIPIIFEKR